MPNSTEQHITPKQAEALEHFDRLGGRNTEGVYGKVAEAMNITEGRAGVYVREALKASGRGDEVNGTRTGGQRGRKAAPPTANAVMEQAIHAFDARVEGIESRVTEAQEAASAFNADEWIAAQEATLNDRVKAAQAALKAWKSDEQAQRKAADDEAARLAERAQAVADEADEALTSARAEREALIAAFDTMKAATA